MNRKIPLLSRVAAIKLAFSPTQADHVSCRLFHSLLDTPRLRALFPTCKILVDIAEGVRVPVVEVEFVTGQKVVMETGRLTVQEIQERLQRSIRRVINAET